MEELNKPIVTKENIAAAILKTKGILILAVVVAESSGASARALLASCRSGVASLVAMWCAMVVATLRD